MTRSTTMIPFHELNFIDHIPTVREVEGRLRKHLSLRTVARMLDRAETLANHTMLH